MKKLLALSCLILLVASLAFALDPYQYDIVMQAGEDYQLEMQMKDGNGNNVDLTGYSYKAQFRNSPAPNGIVFATYSAVFANQTGGRLNVKLSAAQTTKNSGKVGVWDLRETNPSGLVTYSVGGKAICRPTVTR